MEQENLKIGKVKFRLNIDVRREKKHSWLNGIKTNIVFVKGRLNFSCKSTTATNVHLTESFLDNWLKNNHIIFTVCLFCFVLRIIVSTLISQLG